MTGSTSEETKALEVLIVEDSRTQAMSLTLQLEGLGFVVRVAETLEAAVAALEERASDVILLDLELPDATGLEGLARLHGAFGEVPIVVLTSSHGQELAIEALQKGAEDYMNKDSNEPGAIERSLRYAIERHQQRNELVALAGELEELNRQKDHVMGVVAHDLRNPLSVVRGYSDFLLSGATGDLEGEQEEIVVTMRRASDYMLQMVEDLLDFTRIQAGVMELEREPTDLAELVREAMRVVVMIAQQKGIEIAMVLAEDLPEAPLDRHKIRQVIDNLLTNAVKFSHRGSRVELRLERFGEQAHLSVQDHGVGIPPEDLPKVFEAFQKTRAKPTGGERSTGLGLAIVRNIVSAHGGDIWVESEVGVGSTFHVSLPLG